jgi:hypothetical protein
MDQQRYSNRKLTVEQVLDARLSYAVGDWDWTKLARKYGVDRSIVRAAALGQTYKHLPMPPGLPADHGRKGQSGPETKKAP